MSSRYRYRQRLGASGYMSLRLGLNVIALFHCDIRCEYIYVTHLTRAAYHSTMTGIQTYKGSPKPVADNTVLYTDVPQGTEIKHNRRVDLLTYLTVSLILAVLAMAAVMARQQIQIIDLQTSNDKLEMYMRTLQLQYPKDEAVSSAVRQHMDIMTGSNLMKEPERQTHPVSDAGSDATSSRVKRNAESVDSCQQPVCQIHAVHLYASKPHVMEGMTDADHDKYLLGESVTVEAGSINRADGFRPSPGPLKIWVTKRWPASRYEYFADITRTGRDGVVKITRDGLYLIYVQVTFQTAALHQSVSLYQRKNGGHKSVIGTCMVSERFETSSITGRDSSSIYLLCPITTTYYLFAGSSLHLESTYEGRRIMLNQYLTYWGIVYLN